MLSRFPPLPVGRHVEYALNPGSRGPHNSFMPNEQAQAISIDIKLTIDGNQWRAAISPEVFALAMTPAAAVSGLLQTTDFYYRTKAMEPRILPKQFKVVSFSDNPNSFGLHGHVLVARDGEAWEVARCRCSPPEDAWQMHQIITAQPDASSRGDWQWAALGCEIPNRLPKPPAPLLAEIWPVEKPSKVKP